MITKDSPQIITIVANILTKGKQHPTANHVWKLNGWYVMFSSFTNEHPPHYIAILLVGPERIVKGDKVTNSYIYGTEMNYIDLSHNKLIQCLLTVIGNKLEGI